MAHRGHRAWSGHGKLMLHRPEDACSVDIFWNGHERAFSGWYLSSQDPRRRGPGRVDTLDHELDYWMPAAGGWTVKDEELFEQQRPRGEVRRAAGGRDPGNRRRDRHDARRGRHVVGSRVGALGAAG